MHATTQSKTDDEYSTGDELELTWEYPNAPAHADPVRTRTLTVQNVVDGTVYAEGPLQEYRLPGDGEVWARHSPHFNNYVQVGTTVTLEAAR